MNKLAVYKSKFKLNRYQKVIIVMAAIIIVMGTIIAWPKAEADEKPTAVIAGCLVDVGECTFQKYCYAEVDEFKDSRTISDIKIPLTTKSFVYEISGAISYGFDMTEITADDIKVHKASKKIIINMPEMYILSHQQDADVEKTYAEDNNVLNPITTDDFRQIRADVEKEAEQTAIKKGVIEETKENASSMIQNMINVLPEYSDYDVELKFVEQDEIRNINDVVTE